jgi:hypothetical protein
MQRMIEDKRSYWTHKNNEANAGYFPTEEKVVQAEMGLIDFTEISRDTKLVIADLTGGEGTQLYSMYNYLKEKQYFHNVTAYYNELMTSRYEIAVERYGTNNDFNLLNSEMTEGIRLYNGTGRNKSKAVVSILRNNPPYIWLEKGKGVIRSEEVFFDANTPYHIAGGILIFEVPLNQLIRQPSLMRKILFKYTNVNIFKFPQEEFKKFNQVVIIGERKKYDFSEYSLAEEWLQRLKNGSILFLDEVEEPVVTLSEKSLLKARTENVIFRDNEVNDITLSNALFDGLDMLLENDKRSDKNLLRVDKEQTPIIEELAGHISNKLASGAFNGMLGNFLVKGGCEKDIHTSCSEEDDKLLTVEKEVIKPYVSVIGYHDGQLFEISKRG